LGLGAQNIGERHHMLRAVTFAKCRSVSVSDRK
jgi:hypothetical protein